MFSKLAKLSCVVLLAHLVGCGVAPPSAADHGPSIAVSPSPVSLRASGAAYKGVVGSQILRGEQFVTQFEYEGVTYFQTETIGPLLARDNASGEVRTFDMFDLAITAGWFTAHDDRYLPGAIRGLFRVGDTLWMGSNGVGVIALDLASARWSRHSSKAVPVVGDHIGVTWADEDYLFSGRDVYSHALRRWLRIDRIPSHYIVSLGWEDSPNASLHRDDRRFAGQDYDPSGFREIRRLEDGVYQFRTRFSNNSVTEARLPKASLDAAFAAGGSRRPEDE